MAKQWRYNVMPLQELIATYLADLIGPRAYAANHQEFICELFRSQLTQSTMYEYGELYNYILSFNQHTPIATVSDACTPIPIEVAENLVGHLKYVVGEMINVSTVMEAALEHPMEVRVDHHGFLWISVIPVTQSRNDDLIQQLMDRETRPYVDDITEDYIPRRYRHVGRSF